MIVQRPSIGAIIALITFVGACFAATLYMWIQFGGPIPMKPESYRMEVAFDDAGGLVSDTDVRIAGVDVGSVKNVELDEETSQTIVEMEIENQFAPRPADTHVVLRQKSPLGEPYIQLSGGSKDAPKVPEGGRLPDGQIEESVVFEDILSTFDPPTRAALTSLLSDQGIALNEAAASLNYWASTLPSFSVNIDTALKVVNEQSAATASLIRDGGDALNAVTERQGQLQGLVANTARMFGAIGARNAELDDAIRILPTFIDETKVTSVRFEEFSDDTTPLIKQLIPAARELSPGLRYLHAFAPDLRRLMRGIRPLTRASKRGVPAFNRFINRLSPLFERSTPWLGDLIPVINYANSYRRELTGVAANVGSASQGTAKPVGAPGQLHYARSALPTSLEALAAFPQRFGTSRSNPYPAPGSALDLPGGLPQFGSYLCVNRPLPSKSPSFSPDIFNNVLDYYMTDVPSDPNPVNPPAPPCSAQTPLGQLLGAGAGLFPQLPTLP